MPLEWFGDRVKNDLQKRAIGAAFLGANEIRNTLIEGMAGPKSGRTYRVPGTRRTYTASAPGEYPAIRTGRLRASFHIVTVKTFEGVAAVIGTNVEYAEPLHNRPEQRGGRPFFDWASTTTYPRIMKIIAKVYQLP